MTASAAIAGFVMTAGDGVLAIRSAILAAIGSEASARDMRTAWRWIGGHEKSPADATWTV